MKSDDWSAASNPGQQRGFSRDNLVGCGQVRGFCALTNEAQHNELQRVEEDQRKEEVPALVTTSCQRNQRPDDRHAHTGAYHAAREQWLHVADAFVDHPAKNHRQHAHGAI